MACNRGAQETYPAKCAGGVEGLSLNRDKLSTVTIDSAARTPYQAEKPPKKLILVLAGVAGSMAGFFLAFVVEFWSKTREGGKEENLIW